MRRSAFVRQRAFFAVFFFFAYCALSSRKRYCLLHPPRQHRFAAEFSLRASPSASASTPGRRPPPPAASPSSSRLQHVARAHDYSTASRVLMPSTGHVICRLRRHSSSPTICLIKHERFIVMSRGRGSHVCCTKETAALEEAELCGSCMCCSELQCHGRPAFVQPWLQAPSLSPASSPEVVATATGCSYLSPSHCCSSSSCRLSWLIRHIAQLL